MSLHHYHIIILPRYALATESGISVAPAIMSQTIMDRINQVKPPLWDGFMCPAAAHIQPFVAKDNNETAVKNMAGQPSLMSGMDSCEEHALVGNIVAQHL